MNKRGTGTILCLIAGLLYATKYVTAAIFMSGVSTWDESLFQSGLLCVGNGLSTFSVISLIIGIAYLVWAEIDEFRSGKNERRKK